MSKDIREVFAINLLFLRNLQKKIQIIIVMGMLKHRCLINTYGGLEMRRITNERQSNDDV